MPASAACPPASTATKRYLQLVLDHLCYSTYVNKDYDDKKYIEPGNMKLLTNKNNFFLFFYFICDTAIRNFCRMIISSLKKRTHKCT